MTNDTDIKKVQLGTLISEKLYQTLKKISKDHGISMNFLIEKASWLYIEKEYPEKSG